MNKRNWKIT